MVVLIVQSASVSVRSSRPTTACTRLPTARFFKGQAPATMSLVEVGLADSAAGEAEALEARRRSRCES